jgi:predicted ABC-type ATPase
VNNPAKHFILVTGSNASGKTSFIHNNVDKLAGYEIIIPDILSANFKKDQYPQFPSPEAVIEYKVKTAILTQRNLVFEAVFQSLGLQDTLVEIGQNGYYMTMYHLLLPDYYKSQAMVARRNLKGGMHIDKETVFENYYENLKNVAASIYLFNKHIFWMPCCP